MSIKRLVKVSCDECGYEDANSYYFGIKKWIFIKNSRTGEDKHFCGIRCYLTYIRNKENEPQLLINKRELDSNSKEFLDIFRRKE